MSLAIFSDACSTLEIYLSSNTSVPATSAEVPPYHKKSKWYCSSRLVTSPSTLFPDANERILYSNPYSSSRKVYTIETEFVLVPISSAFPKFSSTYFTAPTLSESFTLSGEAHEDSRKIGTAIEMSNIIIFLSINILFPHILSTSDSHLCKIILAQGHCSIASQTI